MNSVIACCVMIFFVRFRVRYLIEKNINEKIALAQTCSRNRVLDDLLYA